MSAEDGAVRPSRSTGRSSGRSLNGMKMGRSAGNRPSGLLDLRFAEDDVLPRDGVVLLQLQLPGLGAGVLLGHIEVAGVRGGHELDLNGVGLGHACLSGR